MNNLFKYIKRSLSMLTAIIIFSLFFLPSNIVYAESSPYLTSEGVTLLDADTGQILFSKNGDKKYYPASTTKIITATIILNEYDNLDTVVTVGKNPPFADGSSIGLREGEKITLEHLLLGLLLESGNDCAEALAEFDAGSKEAFAKKMNDFAKAIGANNSHFTNPSGLPDENHYTTPNDLALFMKEAIKNPKFVEMTRIVMLQLPPSNLDGSERWLNNHNSILLKNSKYFYEYSLSAKRGYTSEARFTNIIASEKDGHRLVASFLMGESIEKVYSDAKTIFNYGYNNFTKNEVYKKGEVITEVAIDDNSSIPVLANEDVYYTTKNGTSDKLNSSLEYTLPSKLAKMSLKNGEVITTAKVNIDGETFKTIDLISGINRDYTNKLALMDFLKENKVLLITLGTALIILIILLTSVHRRRTKKKRFMNKWEKVINRKK
ncbi:serine hydrolase [Clostridium paraputrificum]|uniref:serine hydrolase n=1 Tax=Clostridium paraputrificum TaxID=29363 RepID=UPI00325C277F